MLSAAFGVRSASVLVEEQEPSWSASAACDYSDCKVLAEYIWLGQSGVDMRSRTIVLDSKPACVEELPVAEIDGSSYGHAPAESCEVYLQPRKIFPDPFRGGDHILVLCDTYVPPLLDVVDSLHNLKPHPSNRRPACEAVMQQASSSAPMFSVVQGYNLQDTGAGLDMGGCRSSSVPLPVPVSQGWRDTGKGGADRVGREVSELHMRACLKAGLQYNSSYADGPSVWHYKLGPCSGIDMADQLSVSRYMLQRVAERRDMDLAYPTDHLLGDWGGSCCQVEFSTQDMRSRTDGIQAVHRQLARLQSNHPQHVLGYCGGGLQRLLASKAGGPCFQRAMQFTVGVGNKNAAVVIPTSTVLNKQGPVVDRRAPCDMDPYMVTMLLACSACNIPCPVDLVPQAPFALAGTRVASYGSPRGSGLDLPSSHRPTDSCASFSWGGSERANSFDSLSGTTTDSKDLLISALDKIDHFEPNTPPMARVSMSCTSADDACSEVCSDASSPPNGPCSLQESLASPLADADQEMFYE